MDLGEWEWQASEGGSGGIGQVVEGLTPFGDLVVTVVVQASRWIPKEIV